ncbi:MAG: hypothetical protein ACI4OP_01645 [Candidatus Coprovivens sp.]
MFNIMIYENINYSKIGNGVATNLLPIGATIELRSRGYRIIDYIMQDFVNGVVYMVVKPISKSEYSAYEILKERGVI